MQSSALCSMTRLSMAVRFRRLPVLAVPLLWAITMCGEELPLQPDSSASHPHFYRARQSGQKRRINGIGNFGEVTPRLFRGAQPNKRGYQALARMGVEIVVDTRGNRTKSEGKEVRRHGMQYVAIPWHCPFPRDETFARFLKLMRDNPNKKVFVHCRLGDDRTGMMIAAYRMAAEGWTADEAMIEMREFGFNQAHHFICPGLASYEKEFPEHLRRDPVFRGLH